jgi:hypothetical protein
MPDTEGNEFWRNTDIIAVPEQIAIAVYTNVRGEIVIRGQDRLDASQDPVITIRRKDVPDLITALNKATRGRIGE